MNISFDAQRAFHNQRGLGNYGRDLISILSRYYPEHNYFLFNPEKTESSLFIPVGNQTEINPETFFQKAFPSTWKSRGTCKRMERIHTDIFHGLSQELPYGIHKLNVKKVVSFHDAIFMRYPEFYDRFYQAIFMQKNQYACRAADRIIAISEQSKRDAVDFFKVDESKVSVIYQGCNGIFRAKVPDKEKSTIRKRYRLPEKFFLTVGTLEPRKNITTLLQAYAGSKQEVPLVIVGRETGYSGQLRVMASELKIDKKVIMLHNVSTEDLPAVYQMADVFVYPSVFEGFGIPILEALCSGVPVITSEGGCFEETGGKDTVYIKPSDPEALGDAMTTVLTDTGLRSRMIASGLEHADNFTDDKIAAKIMALYQEL